jgi:hypothetical protein
VLCVTDSIAPTILQQPCHHCPTAGRCACRTLKFLLAGSLILQMAMLSHAQKPGSGPAPATDTTGTGTCAADGSDYTYVETVSGTTRTVVTNHCPNHVWTTMNPNYPIAGDTTYTMPSQVRAPLKTAGGAQRELPAVSFQECRTHVFPASGLLVRALEVFLPRSHSCMFVAAPLPLCFINWLSVGLCNGAQPMYDESMEKDLTSQGGTVGVIFDGSMLFSGYAGPNIGQQTNYETSATSLEGDTFDSVRGL